MKRYAVLFLLALVCGCAARTTTVTRAGLDAKASERSGTSTPDQTYYVGSDSRHDYFVIRSGLGERSRLYRVAEAEGTVTNRFVATKDETEWRGYRPDVDAQGERGGTDSK